jgi:hypothetical protein
LLLLCVWKGSGSGVVDAWGAKQIEVLIDAVALLDLHPGGSLSRPTATGVSFL